jgi:hypothetical protein
MVIVVLACFFASAAYASEKDVFQVKKQPELWQVKPPAKITVRRSARNAYIRELSGDDSEEIVKTDKKLRKMQNLK